MVWSSVSLMTSIDAVLLALVLYLVWLFRRHSDSARRLGMLSAVRLILAGLVVVAAFYLLDLLTMHVGTRLLGHEVGMRLMMELHLEWSWLFTLVSVSLLGGGIAYLLRELLPKASASMESLEALAEQRASDLKTAGETLAHEHAELQEMTERFALAARGTDDGIWDSENPLEESAASACWWSPRYRELLRLAEDEPAPHWLSRLHPRDRPTTLDRLRAHLDERAPFDLDCRLRSGDGEYRWFRLTGQASWNTDGGLRRMAGSVRDVTEARRDSLRMVQLNLAVENAMTGISRLDTDDRFSEVHPVFARLLGYDDPMALVGESWSATVVPDDHPRRAQAHAEMLDTGHAQTVVRCTCKDGSEIVAELRLVGITDEDDTQQGHFCFMRDVTAEHELSRELHHQARHDALTGLVNRGELERRLMRALEGARTQGRDHALLYMDLDQFKIINDSCGHAAGDELLRQLGQVLQDEVRGGDTVARLGGDEFGILILDCGEAQAMRIAGGLRAAVQEFAFSWEGKTFGLGASIGVSTIDDRSGTLADLLKDVDSACYAAKEDGRNRVHLHRPDDARVAELHGEMRWVARLHAALAQDRFVLYRQPIASVGNRVGGGAHFEILLRLADEDGRLVPPGAFLPAAERYGLMNRIDAWVIASALDWLGGAGVDESVELCHVNLSGASLAADGFLEEVLTLLDGSDVDPAVLCFEITETAAIANLGAARRFIDVLRERGCSFALDDFGSGLSSFAYLKNLPVDYVKIDGLFVRDICEDPIDHAMVRAIHEVTMVLGKASIAEFVETEECLARLRVLGVDFAQGYWLGAPQPLRPDGDMSAVAATPPSAA